jgi:hypothetical protein
VTWFRRGREPDHEGPAPSPLQDDDSPATLRQRLFDLNRYINANAGKLPVGSVVTARQVTDTLREVIDTSDVRPLDIYAVVSVKGILNDYLPTTLQRFLALDPNILEVPRPSGRTPAESLHEQIDSLWDAAANVLEAAKAQDADALLTQGNFLRTKFAGSDLDL